MKSKNFILSAFLLAGASLIAKFIGGLYRIPLTNILGTEGIGLYQLVFPLFSLILVATSLGLPNGLAKIISEKLASGKGYEVEKIFKTSLLFFSFITLILSIIIYYSADLLSTIQGNTQTVDLYKVIAPSIFFVGVLSVFRGYFQGFQITSPTGVSLIVEQIGKAIFGLFFAIMLLPKGIEYGALGAVFGVTLSEIIACVIIAYQFHFSKKLHTVDNSTYYIESQVLQYSLDSKPISIKLKAKEWVDCLKEILKTTIPITLSSLILPLTLFIDSFLIINLLQSTGYSVDVSTNMYGIMTGIVNSLINLPSVFAIAVATCLIPAISESHSKSNTIAVEKKSKLSIKIVLYISIPIFAVYLAIPDKIIALLYSDGLASSQFNEFGISTNLLRLSSISVITIALLQVITTVLQAINKSKIPLKNLGLACIVKILLTIFLIKYFNMNIIGAMTATIICYLIACFLNIGAMKKYVHIEFDLIREIIIPVLSSIVMAIILYESSSLLINLPLWLNLAISLGVSASIYTFIIFYSKSINFKEFKTMKNGIK